MPSRRKSRKSRKSRSRFWHPSAFLKMMTTPGRPKKSRKSKKSRRSYVRPADKSLFAAEYGSAKRSRSRWSAEYGSKRRHHHHRRHSAAYASSSRKARKATGVVCVCGAVCKKRHEHDKSCRTSVACVCVASKNGKNKSRKMRETAMSEPKLIEEMSHKAKPKERWSRGLNLKKGTLTNHGYSANASDEVRHVALRKAVAAEKGGVTAILRKLNVIANLNAKRNPTLTSKFRKDSHWLKEHMGTTKHPKVKSE